MKYIEDNFILIYCFILFNLAFLFLGHELAQMQHDAEMRTANTKLQNCNYILTKGSLYQ